MLNLTSMMNWQILLLISPLVFGIALFGFLLWSDRRYEQQVKERIGNI